MTAHDARTSRFVDLGGGVYVRPDRVDAVDTVRDDACYAYLDGGGGVTIERPAAAVVADLERALREKP